MVKAPSRSRGFTLIELVVVLAILAVLASIAVRSLDARVDQAKFEATQRQLREIKDAVFGPQDLRNADGSLMATGFMSDMGRPPKCRVSDADASLGLHELWSNTLSLPKFALRQASGGNITSAYTLAKSGVAWTATPLTLYVQDSAVFVPCGYRGPYLDLPQGETGLKDGWDSVADPRPFVLLQAGSLAPISFPSSTIIGGVVSYGADGTKDTAPNENPYNTDLPPIQFIDDGSGVNSLGTIYVSVTVKGGAVPSTPANLKLKLRLYAPDPDSGLITYYEAPEQSVVSSTDDQTFALEFPVSSLVNGKTICNIGARVLRAAIVDPANATVNIKSSTILPVTISINRPTTFNLTVQ